MDNLTPEQRKKNMRAIRSKDTKSECVLREELWRRGYRYRKNYNKVSGRPDIVFIGKKLAVFCDGEFWHGYNYNENTDVSGTNKEYWNQKIKRNIERDKEVTINLEFQGWAVLRFWSKQIQKDLDGCVSKIIGILNSK
jgi:DNA mismatch endonuclease (patch repair protein)